MGSFLRIICIIIYIETSPSVSVALRRFTLSQRPLRDFCSFVFGAACLKQQPLHGLASLL